MAQNNIIELNGKRYDAVSGALLGLAPSKDHLPGAPRSQRGRAIDGFFRAPNAPGAQAAAKAVAKPVAAPIKVGTKKASPSERSAHTIKPHQPEHGKTLMRRAVHKPDFKMKKAIKPQAPAELMAKPMSEVARPLQKKLSVANVNPLRLSHAKHVPRSHHIQRFAHEAKGLPASFSVPTAVVPAPPQRAMYQSAPVRHAAVGRPVQSSIRPAVAHQKAAPVHKDPTDIFEKAIAHATSHEQKPPMIKRRSNKALNIVAAVASFVIIAGFVAYLNVNTINMRIASMHAGFSARVPGYHLTGYALGPIKTEKGKVSLSFRSGDSTYQLTQQTSDWNSQTLLENYVAMQASTHDTVQSKGRTIYIFNGNRATWVNGGVRYDLNGGNAALNTADIVSLATSI